jgi:glycosyltransferase involved in cell wall biosynthesis
MENHIRIIGILLVRNEDIFIERIVSNIIDFCDEIIVADNNSTDRTADVVMSMRKKNPKIKYYFITHPAQSHELIVRYADSPTWIFAVDGDELYDPRGLDILRRKILLGEYDKRWMIFGNVLHCIEINQERQIAWGYLTPPCRSMTKLYNFAIIKSWEGPCPERLHGGTISFYPTYSKQKKFPLYEEMEWEVSYFRCLHLCFLRRSSQDKVTKGDLMLRENISEKNSLKFHEKMLNIFSRLRGRKKDSQYKREKYMRGPVVEKNIESFFL